jgi:hypothetical protein
MMVRRALALVSVIPAACLDTTIDPTATEATPPASTSSGEPTTSGSSTGSTGSTSGSTSSTSTSTGETTDAGSSTGSTGEPGTPPSIDEVLFPSQILAAGPVTVTVYTQHTMTLRAELDGAPLDVTWQNYDGIFKSEIPILASHEPSQHELKLIAESVGFPDAVEIVPFTVETPATGLVAWERFGPPGSVTHGLAVNDWGVVYEVGALEIDGVEYPSLQLRNGVDGQALWEDGPKRLDDREGRAVAVAVAPDRDVWIAMNIRDGGNWRPRIVVMPPNAEFWDLGQDGAPGSTIEALAATDDGGCIGVGFGVSPMGDGDVRLWRMNANAEPLVWGQAWDYAPGGMAHEFSDFGFAVAVDGNEAWIAGASRGLHEIDEETRGMLVRVDADTLDLLGPVIIAPVNGQMPQSTFFGVTLAPNGVLVSGNECDKLCATQRVSLFHYTAGGLPTKRYLGKTKSVAFGMSVARNMDGISLVAANEKDNVLRGTMVGHVAGDVPEFNVDLPGQTSEMNATAAEPYGWMFWGGSITLNQVRRAHVAKLHP